MQAAEADLKAAKAAYDAAAKRLEALSSSPAPLQTLHESVGSANASYTVRAPLSGYVTKVNKSLGEQVQPGEAIVEISNLDTVWVEAPIFERDLSRLAGNVSATFTTPAYPNQEFKGVVLDIGAVIDEQTRASKVTFQLPNDGRALTTRNASQCSSRCGRTSHGDVDSQRSSARTRRQEDRLCAAVRRRI